MFKHYILKRKGVKQLRNPILKRLAILLLCIGIHGGLAIFPWPTASHLSTTSVSADGCRPLTLALVPLVNSPSDIEWCFSLDVVDGGVVVVDEDGAEAEERAKFIIREET